MAEPTGSQTIPLTVYLSPEVARRLALAAEAQKRAAAQVVADLLDRHLPRLPSSEQKKGNIPYT